MLGAFHRNFCEHIPGSSSAFKFRSSPETSLSGLPPPIAPRTPATWPCVASGFRGRPVQRDASPDPQGDVPFCSVVVARHKRHAGFFFFFPIYLPLTKESITARKEVRVPGPLPHHAVRCPRGSGPLPPHGPAGRPQLSAVITWCPQLSGPGRQPLPSLLLGVPCKVTRPALPAPGVPSASLQLPSPRPGSCHPFMENFCH